MRASIALLLASLAGVVGGAVLIGWWAVGCAVIFDSLCVGAFAVWGYDDGRPVEYPPRLARSLLTEPESVPLTLQQVLDRARAS